MDLEEVCYCMRRSTCGRLVHGMYDFYQYQNPLYQTKGTPEKKWRGVICIVLILQSCSAAGDSVSCLFPSRSSTSDCAVLRTRQNKYSNKKTHHLVECCRQLHKDEEIS